MRIIRKLLYGVALTAWIAIAESCTCHHFEEPTVTMKVGHVLCTDGEVMPICRFLESTKEAIGIVFYVNPNPNDDVKGYAVYLHDLAPTAFSESIEYSQGTSCDFYAEDGNENTYALFNNSDVASPMASEVFDLWKYGQSAYVPSVQQLRLLFAAKAAINDRIAICGGDALPDLADECWYWTSTEVNGQSEAKAWLYSLHSGAVQETPKTQVHKVRPVITIKN